MTFIEQMEEEILEHQRIQVFDISLKGKPKHWWKHIVQKWRLGPKQQNYYANNS